MTSEMISAAMVAALTVAEKTGATELTKKAVGDAYDYLKGVIRGTFGDTGEVAQAVEKLEGNAASKPRKAALAEELGLVGAVNHLPLTAATNALLSAIRDVPGGEQHIQTVTGDYNAVADRGSTASVTVSGSWRSRE